MDCREFRNKHVCYVDDLLSAVEMDAMQQHLMICSRCSRQDTAVRRSLMLVRNLPTIQPSPDFIVRLNARLESLGPASRVDLVAPRPYLPSVGAFAALAAGVAAVAYMAIETTRYFAPPQQAAAPIVAASVEPMQTPISDAAFAASVPTGIPVWSAVLMVGQAPMHFASMDFHEAEPTR
jgi:hypothetical protein